MIRHPVPVREAEDLKTAGIGEDRPVPAHERVQAARAPPPRPRRAAAPGDRCSPAASRCPVPRICSGVNPLTVACVPTGMKAGVSTGPCARLQQAAARWRSAVLRQGSEPDRPERPRVTIDGVANDHEYGGPGRRPKLDPGGSRSFHARASARAEIERRGSRSIVLEFQAERGKLLAHFVERVTPKFLHSRSSSPVCLSRSPTV